ncbi:ABC transporter ATP-binding protein [Propionicicella superfundia]|uniref:ABC transporter ATP-binding protein n=1 Tax=Propionicicella superfundia TaxID=348582 RepID=UPI0004145375|nr:ABC transporter ATP-binding protein [Propionicicella superfundia]
MSDVLLRGRGVSRDHRLPRTKVFGPAPVRRVLHGADVDIHAGEAVAIIGESGSGKSTLVRILLGLQHATAGTVEFDGRPVRPRGIRTQHWLRRRTGIVLQDPYASLNPRLTVARIVAEPLRSLQIDGDHRRLIGEVLERVGLPHELASAYPHALSGGQRQRVAIARAIVHRPDLLVGDEPMSALDVTLRASILELLRDLQRERGMSLVVVSHDLGLVRHFADRVFVLHDGRIVEQGPTHSLFHHPRHEYTRRLVDAVPRFSRPGAAPSATGDAPRPGADDPSAPRGPGGPASESTTTHTEE